MPIYRSSLLLHNAMQHNCAINTTKLCHEEWPTAEVCVCVCVFVCDCSTLPDLVTVPVQRAVLQEAEPWNSVSQFTVQFSLNFFL